MNKVKTDDLEIAYDVYGTPKNSQPIIMLHGFPDDASAWAETGTILAKAGYYALAPYVRGCGKTRFISPDTPRSGKPAARARDVIDFMDALSIDSAVIIGQDWGATTAQALAILYPKRVARLVLLNGQGLLNMLVFGQGKTPSWATFHAGWYQWLFQAPFAAPLLAADRRGFARYAWEQWSPDWTFDDTVFQRVCQSFDNPDWIDVVMSAYQMNDEHDDARDGEASTTLSSDTVAIQCPVLHLQGKNDGVDLYVDTNIGQRQFYKNTYSSKRLERCGHFLQREQPEAVAREIADFLQSESHV